MAGDSTTQPVSPTYPGTSGLDAYQQGASSEWHPALHVAQTLPSHSTQSGVSQRIEDQKSGHTTSSATGLEPHMGVHTHDRDAPSQKNESQFRYPPSNSRGKRLGKKGLNSRGLGGLLGHLGHRLLGQSVSRNVFASRGRLHVGCGTEPYSSGKPDSLIYLQTSELGRHANEEEMPSWLTSLLQEQKEPRNSGQTAVRS